MRKEPSPSSKSSEAAPVVQRLRLHQRILRDFGRIALEDIEVKPLLQRAVAQAARATGVRHTKIMRYRVDQGDLLVEAGVGWRPGVVGRTRFGSDPAAPPGRALQTGQPVLIDDIRAHPEYRVHPVILEHGIVSLLNVPITFDGTTWGVLEADSEDPGHFDEVDIEFLEVMAAQIAGALQRCEAVRKAEAAASEAAVQAERGVVLLRELQHRSKNNLALVVAMLGRERRTANAEQDTRSAVRLGQMMQRVTAVALAQDRLAIAETGGLGDGTGTDLAGYLRALLGSLELTLEGRVTIEANLEECAVPFDKAVAVGLATNELVTNAAKYAYPEEQEGGALHVTLTADEYRAEAVLTVSDDGVGMVHGKAARRSEEGGQGLELVRQLARQLGGEVEFETPERGTSVAVRFPLVL